MWSGKVLQIVFSVRRGNIYTFFYFKYLSCINWLINNDQNISHCWRKYKLETRFLKRKVHDFFKKKKKKRFYLHLSLYTIYSGAWLNVLDPVHKLFFLWAPPQIHGYSFSCLCGPSTSSSPTLLNTAFHNS